MLPNEKVKFGKIFLKIDYGGSKNFYKDKELKYVKLNRKLKLKLKDFF